MSLRNTKFVNSDPKPFVFPHYILFGSDCNFEYHNNVIRCWMFGWAVIFGIWIIELVCCNPLGPPVRLRTTGTVGWQCVLLVCCVQLVSVTLILLTWRIWWAPNNASKWQMGFNSAFNPLNAELNPICYLLALLEHHFLHVSRIRVKSLTLRLLMSYIHGAPILDVSRSHTTTHHSR